MTSLVTLLFIVWMTIIVARAYSPSGRWEHVGRTVAQTEDDQAHCHKLARQESGSDGQTGGDPFKEVRTEQTCMRRLGYTLK
jgi:hypothetical protein